MERLSGQNRSRKQVGWKQKSSPEDLLTRNIVQKSRREREAWSHICLWCCFLGHKQLLEGQLSPPPSFLSSAGLATYISRAFGLWTVPTRSPHPTPWFAHFMLVRGFWEAQDPQISPLLVTTVETPQPGHINRLAARLRQKYSPRLAWL